jgi:predicted dehydrogenase
VLLAYPDRGGAVPSAAERMLVRTTVAAPRAEGRASVGVIGAGNFAVRTLLPVLAKSGARLRAIASGGGTSAAIAQEKFGFERASTSVEAILDDGEIDTVFVLTRHDAHARLAARALRAGKHVFVEKPLALTEAELDDVEQAAAESGRLLMVGFNRRFAPLTAELLEALRGRAGPLSIVCTVNAGAIPRDHWTQDAAVGGGRIVGEACHFVDVSRALAQSPIAGVQVTTAADRDGRPVDDLAHLAIRFRDGSTAVVHYLSSGAKSFPKERIECFFDGKTLVVDNWRRLRRFGVKGPWFERTRAMDKGHDAEVGAWVRAVEGRGAAPIPLDEVLEVSRWSIRAAELARSGKGAA